jgi:hypothetical protein
MDAHTGRRLQVLQDTARLCLSGTGSCVAAENPRARLCHHHTYGYLIFPVLLTTVKKILTSAFCWHTFDNDSEVENLLDA